MEMIVVIGIFTVIVSVGLVVNLSFFKTDIFQAEETIIVSALQKARSRSINNIYGSVHGVCFVGTSYRIFYGRTSCLPISSKDETIGSNASVATASNFSTSFPTVIFSQLAGTTTGATIHITDGIKSADIITNYEGTIIW